MLGGQLKVVKVGQIHYPPIRLRNNIWERGLLFVYKNSSLENIFYLSIDISLTKKCRLALLSSTTTNRLTNFKFFYELKMKWIDIKSIELCIHTLGLFENRGLVVHFFRIRLHSTTYVSTYIKHHNFLSKIFLPLCLKYTP